MRLCEQIHMAYTLDDALANLNRYQEGIQVLAGGTDLLIFLRSNGAFQSKLLDISGLDHLRTIREGSSSLCDFGGKEWLEIGALTTHSQITSSPVIKEKAPLFWQACRRIGSVQIRNRGTLGGNLVTASPAGDSIPALMCLDAQVVLTSSCGQRVVPLNKFFLGPGSTVRLPEELLTSVLVQTQQPQERSLYLKLGQRNALSISIASVALRLKPDSEHSNILRNAAVAFGALAPTVVRARRIEDAIIGVPLTEGTTEELADMAYSEVMPITDIRASAEYRRAMAGALLKKGLQLLKVCVR